MAASLPADQTATASLPADALDRASWLRMAEAERVTRYLSLAPQLGIACSKIGIAKFDYPSLGRKLRGAVALADIAAREEFCVVPEAQMVSILTLRNTTMAPLIKFALKTNALKNGPTRDGWQVPRDGPCNEPHTGGPGSFGACPKYR